MSLAVAICTYNGAHRVGTAVESVLANPDVDLLVVVDDGSNDDTVAVVRAAFATRPDVATLLLESDHAGVWAARQQALLTTAGFDLLAFLDDDCRVEPTWTRDLLAAWTANGDDIVAMGSKLVPASHNTLNRRYVEIFSPLNPVEAGFSPSPSLAKRLWWYLRPPHASGRRTVASVVGAGMSFRTQALLDVGGWPTQGTSGEDEFICSSLRRHFGNESVVVDESIVVAHEYEPVLADTYRRARWYGQGAGQRWADEGGLPTIRPGVFLALLAGLGAGGLSLLMFDLWSALALGVVTALVVPYLLWGARSLRSPGTGSLLERLVYPLITLRAEASNAAGFLRGVASRRVRKNATPGR
jgi:cellulose synthase/poly-beta-1,6-N-acetylglucosamine synthase-like glycosyltransferase